MTEIKVPSAKQYFDDYDDNDDIEIIMQKFARLHLESMLSEITSGDEKVLLKRDIEKTGNNYISKIA